MSYPGHHIKEGEFQSDKFPILPRNLVPINASKPRNWPGLLLIADAYQEKDAEFAEDLRGYIQSRAEAEGVSYIEMPKGRFWALPRMGLRVYLIRDADVEQRIVEAPNYAAAVKAWREHLVAEWKASGDYEPDDELHEPVSVELISDEAVVRPGLAVLAGRVCRVCRCTDVTACRREGRSCSWVELDLCSACAKKDGDPFHELRETL